MRAQWSDWMVVLVAWVGVCLVVAADGFSCIDIDGFGIRLLLVGIVFNDFALGCVCRLRSFGWSEDLVIVGLWFVILVWA